MDMKAIGTVLAGATILYAGFLSLGNDFYVGTGMLMGGVLVAATPIWKAMRKPSATIGKSSAKGKRKTRLKIVNDPNDRPTYH